MYLKVGIIFQMEKGASSFRGLGSKIERKMTGGILALYHAGLSPGVLGVPWYPQILADLVNPIWTRRGRLCPPHYYWHPRIFRPSYSPGIYSPLLTWFYWDYEKKNAKFSSFLSFFFLFFFNVVIFFCFFIISLDWFTFVTFMWSTITSSSHVFTNPESMKPEILPWN